MEHKQSTGKAGVCKSLKKVGAGDRGRTGDVQLGNLRSDWKQTTYATKALDPDHQKPRKSGLLRTAEILTQ